MTLLFFIAEDGGWGKWGCWSHCLKNYYRRRHRVCNYPIPKGWGKYCYGDHTQYYYFKSCKYYYYKG